MAKDTPSTLIEVRLLTESVEVTSKAAKGEWKTKTVTFEVCAHCGGKVPDGHSYVCRVTGVNYKGDYNLGLPPWTRKKEETSTVFVPFGDQKSQTKPPKPETTKEAFKIYNERWNNSAPISPFITLPFQSSIIPGIMESNMRQLVNHLDNLSSLDKTPSSLTIHRKVRLFFLSAFDINMAAPDIDRLESLLEHIKRKEMLRWHPDKLNLRTGREGVIDQMLGRHRLVACIWGTIESMIEELEKALKVAKG